MKYEVIYIKQVKKKFKNSVELRKFLKSRKFISIDSLVKINAKGHRELLKR